MIYLGTLQNKTIFVINASIQIYKGVKKFAVVVDYCIGLLFPTSAHCQQPVSMCLC